MQSLLNISINRGLFPLQYRKSVRKPAKEIIELKLLTSEVMSFKYKYTEAF